MTVLLSALRGGNVEWHVQIGITDYTDSLISVKGIAKQSHFDGSYTSSTVTIELYGDVNIAANQGVAVSIKDSSLDSPVNIWAGLVKIIKNLSAGTKEVTCKGALNELNQNFSFYYPRSAGPRWMYNYILQAALPRGWNENAYLYYNDNYHRNAVRCAAKYSTLGKLSGVAVRGSTYLRAYTSSGSQKYGKTLTNNVDLFDFQDWQTFIKDESLLVSAPSNPLAWHRKTANIVGIIASFSNGNSPSYWPLGQDMNMTARMYIGSFNIYPSFKIEPSSSNDQAPQESVASWRGTNEDELYNASYTPSSAARVKDTYDFNLTLGTTNQPEGTIIYGDLSQAQFKGKIIYKHTNNTSELKSLYSSYGAQYRYQLEQKLTLATINAEEFTYKHMQQCAFLGSFCLSETGENLDSSGNLVKGYRYVDVCPEKGTLFDVPICSSTCSEVTFVQQDPLPQSARVNFRDPMGKDYTYEVEIDNNSTLEPVEIDVMQGQLMGGSKNYGNRNNPPEYSLCSSIWIENPGFLIDRWTGVTMPGVEPSFSYFAGDRIIDGHVIPINVDLRIQNGAGIQASLLNNLEPGAYAYGQDSDYCVTEKTGAKRYTFCLYARIKPQTLLFADYALPYSDTPWLDTFPIQQLRTANNRVFPDGRETWSAKVSLAFANCEPGDVVILNMPEIKSVPYLALITKVILDSSSPFCTIEFSPMFPVSGASSSDWPNLTEIVTMSQSNNAITTGKPYLPAQLLINNTLPPVEYDNIYILNSYSNFSLISTDWYVLQQDGDNVKWPMNPNCTVYIHAKNSVTGYQSDFVIKPQDWETGENKRQRKAHNERLNNAVYGEGHTGYGLMFLWDIGAKTEVLIISNATNPIDLINWTITYRWDNAEAPAYEWFVVYPASLWRHTNVYMSTGYLYDDFDAFADLPDYSVYTLRFTDAEGNTIDFAANRFVAGSSSTASSYYYFDLPDEGVFTEFRLLVSTYYADTSLRCTIGSSYRAGFPSNSAFASTYFNDDYTLKDGCSIAIVRQV